MPDNQDPRALKYEIVFKGPHGIERKVQADTLRELFRLADSVKEEFYRHIEHEDWVKREREQ